MELDMLVIGRNNIVSNKERCQNVMEVTPELNMEKGCIGTMQKRNEDVTNFDHVIGIMLKEHHKCVVTLKWVQPKGVNEYALLMEFPKPYDLFVDFRESTKKTLVNEFIKL
jgi:hypothetical protein